MFKEKKKQKKPKKQITKKPKKQQQPICLLPSSHILPDFGPPVCLFSSFFPPSLPPSPPTSSAMLGFHGRCLRREAPWEPLWVSSLMGHPSRCCWVQPVFSPLPLHALVYLLCDAHSVLKISTPKSNPTVFLIGRIRWVAPLYQIPSSPS